MVHPPAHTMGFIQGQRRYLCFCYAFLLLPSCSLYLSLTVNTETNQILMQRCLRETQVWWGRHWGQHAICSNLINCLSNKVFFNILVQRTGYKHFNSKSPSENNSKFACCHQLCIMQINIYPQIWTHNTDASLSLQNQNLFLTFLNMFLTSVGTLLWLSKCSLCMCLWNKGHNESSQDSREHFTDETTHTLIVHAWTEETTLLLWYFIYAYKNRDRLRKEKFWRYNAENKLKNVSYWTTSYS